MGIEENFLKKARDLGKIQKENSYNSKGAQSFYSVPNIITLVRLIGSLLFFTLALLNMMPLYNFIGLGIHWFGDVLDGIYARRFKQETILGAEIDIIADRVEIIFFYVNFLFFNPNLFLPVIIYLLNFAFVDFYLSYQFIKYDIISPNYFYKVDRTVYKLNFSPLAKFCNSSVVTLTLIFLPQLWLAAVVFSLVLIGVKIYSVTILHKKRENVKRAFS